MKELNFSLAQAFTPGSESQTNFPSPLQGASAAQQGLKPETGKAAEAAWESILLCTPA
jgi:outer membrane receptor protein involved in Fe transport